MRHGSLQEYYVYILASSARTLYIGVTNHSVRRVFEHKQGQGGGFTSRYNVNKLVYHESTTDVLSAITREKELKGWRRNKKLALVESTNPEWKDLALRWYDDALSA